MLLGALAPRLVDVAGGADQAGLLGGEGDEHERARRARAGREGSGERDEAGRAGRVVVGAGVDLAASVRPHRAELAVAEVVVVRADHDGREPGLGARQAADHVRDIALAALDAHGAGHASTAELRAEAAVGRAHERAELEARARGDALARAARERERDHAGRGARRERAHRIFERDVVRSLEARREEHRARAVLARGQQLHAAPPERGAALVREGGPLRAAVEHEHDRALDVEPIPVVPAALLVAEAVAREHERAPEAAVLAAQEHAVVAVRGQRPAAEREPRLGDADRDRHPEGLEEAAVGCAGLEAGLGEAPGQMLRSRREPRGAEAAPFARRVGEPARVALPQRAVHGGACSDRPAPRRRARAGEEQEEKQERSGAARHGGGSLDAR